MIDFLNDRYSFFVDRNDELVILVLDMMYITSSSSNSETQDAIGLAATLLMGLTV